MWTLVFEVLVCLGVAHFWIKHRLSYWKRNGVCSVKSAYFFGNMKKAGRRHFSEISTECYRKLKHKDVIGGFYFFLQPKLILFKPNIIGHVLAKDCSYFAGRHSYYNEQADPMSVNLSTVEGHRAKELRAKITPTMTTAKLKAMFDGAMVQVSSELEKQISELSGRGGPIDVKDLSSRFATDLISRCGFGVENNSLKDPNNEFRKMSLKLVEPKMKKFIKGLFTNSFVDVSHILGIRVVDEKLSKYFTGIIKERAAQQKGNDLLSSLLEISRRTGGIIEDSNKQTITGQLTFDEVCAQTLLSVTSALGSTATTMSWCIYELAKRPSVQDKLIEEVQRVLDSQELCYDALQEMTYLEQVVLGECGRHLIT